MDRFASIAASVRVAESGGFTTAARRLDLSTTTVSDRKRSVSGPAQAAARVASNGCQFQGRSSAIRRAGWSAMRASRSAR